MSAVVIANGSARISVSRKAQGGIEIRVFADQACEVLIALVFESRSACEIRLPPAVETPTLRVGSAFIPLPDQATIDAVRAELGVLQ